ncbi:MAG: hypothetical protein ABSF77_20610 [Spirochaetia bacterium]|jgi:hypothetical protein
MKARFVFTLCLLCAACAALSSCTANGGAIYATIETEKLVTTNTLPLTLTIEDIVKTAPNHYYVAAGGIFYGDTSTDPVTWNPNVNSPIADRPYNPPDGLCNALAYYGGTLWGGFFTTGSNLGLYKAIVQADGTYSFENSTAETDSTIAGKQVVLLQPLNGHLFMVSASLPAGSASYAYEVDYLSSSTSAWTVLIAGLTSAVTGLAWDGTHYWMTTGSTVYEDASDPPSFASGTSTLSSGSYSLSGIKGIYADSIEGGRVFIATTAGGIYYSPDAGLTWEQAKADVISSVTIGYLTVAGPVDAANNTYLVGSDGYGYYTLSLSSNPPTLTRYSDSTIALYTESIGTILVDGTTVFMGTNSEGLWSTTFDPSTGAISTSSAWTHE